MKLCVQVELAGGHDVSADAAGATATAHNTPQTDPTITDRERR
jgi:hypothetical protein